MPEVLTGVEYTVNWVMQQDGENMIRFAELPKPCELSKELAAYNWVQAGIRKGASVLAVVEENTVIKLTIMSSNVKQEEKIEPSNIPNKGEQEKMSESTGLTKTLTVAGVSFKNKGIIFEEEEKKWYTLDEKVLGYMKTQNLTEKGTKVKVTIEKSDNPKKNDLIVRAEVATTEKASTPSDAGKGDAPKNDYQNKKSYNDDSPEKRLSIEAQGAVERAYIVVAKMLQGQSPETVLKNIDTVKAIASQLAQHAFQTIQSLKK